MNGVVFSMSGMYSFADYRQRGDDRKEMQTQLNFFVGRLADSALIRGGWTFLDFSAFFPYHECGGGTGPGGTGSSLQPHEEFKDGTLGLVSFGWRTLGRLIGSYWNGPSGRSGSGKGGCKGVTRERVGKDRGGEGSGS
jgi:hypothetical protein